MATAHPPPPITTQKSAFLNRQIRALSAPLAVPSSAHTSLPSLSDKNLTELLNKTNDKVKSHNRAVFSAQATRHIAEQIETLYWNEVRAEREAINDANQPRAETTVPRDIDLSTSEGLAQLGETWTENLSTPLDANTPEPEPSTTAQDAQYTSLHTQLQTLITRRDAALVTLRRYQRLQTLLEPYEDPQRRIQPNLVTKDGELARELERMRSLLARVTARMGEQKELQGQAVSAASESAEGHGRAFEDKLRVVLDGN
jgi:hypothetical protein